MGIRIISQTRSPGPRFKLTHRDMGPRARYLGPEVPAEELIGKTHLGGQSTN